jgi:hypothetical protein
VLVEGVTLGLCVKGPWVGGSFYRDAQISCPSGKKKIPTLIFYENLNYKLPHQGYPFINNYIQMILFKFPI